MFPWLMHAPAVREQALRLVDAGVNDCEIGRRLGVPRTTVRDWRAPRYVSSTVRCPRCWEPARRMTLADGDYAELLALYLGDGCVARVGRTHSLRLSLDAGHPSVLLRCRALLERCFPANRVCEVRVAGSAAVVLCVYSRHMPCVFPQHGPGKKHQRRIVLEPWQLATLRAEPWRFLRGCINSDGCCFTNRTGRYTYRGYGFHNLSSDILDLFTYACNLVDVDYRRYANAVRINRRPSVALFEQNVGTKG